MTTFDAEAEISRLVTKAKLSKEQAKDARDDGDIQSAIDVLIEAIASLDASPLARKLLEETHPNDAQKKLAFQLADCLGMLGGNYRRKGELSAALAAFTRGQEIEESEPLQVPSSYNLVNAITLPLEMKTRSTVQQRVALERAVAAIQRQVQRERASDRWAWADLGECQLLLADVNQAKTSYQRVLALGNTDTFESVAGVLKRLAASLTSSEPDVSRALNQGIAWMDAGVVG